jgi:hypothetical protein
VPRGKTVSRLPTPTPLHGERRAVEGGPGSKTRRRLKSSSNLRNQALESSSSSLAWPFVASGDLAQLAAFVPALYRKLHIHRGVYQRLNDAVMPVCRIEVADEPGTDTDGSGSSDPPHRQ